MICHYSFNILMMHDIISRCRHDIITPCDYDMTSSIILIILFFTPLELRYSTNNVHCTPKYGYQTVCLGHGYSWIKNVSILMTLFLILYFLQPGDP